MSGASSGIALAPIFHTIEAPGHFAVQAYDGRFVAQELRSVSVHGVPDYVGFIANSFRSWQWKTRCRDALVRALVEPGAGVVVLVAAPVDDPGSFLGWLAAAPSQNRIIYAYTKFIYRRKPDEESPFRIASSLAIAAGVDFTRPVPCSFWGRVPARLIAQPGSPYQLVHRP
jgi:hypothetical protein